jgi:hypothetical protein
MATKVASQVASPSRNIPEPTRILLAVRSGGRCEFAGCNKYTFEDALTLQHGNYSERAHIVAFSEHGPRGQDGQRPEEIHSIDNLMHVCFDCHKRIDDHPDDYPRDVLEAYKAEHEERIRHVTGLGPDLKTSVVQLKAPVAGQVVDIPVTHVYDAVAPRWPTDRRGVVIDLASVEADETDDGVEVAKRKIRQKIDNLYEEGMDVQKTRHISLFALAPIPLLVYAGSRLSNKIAVDLFQRHRDQESPWKWLASGDPVQYAQRVLQKGTDTRHVALVLSLSGTIQRRALPAVIDDTFTVFELTLVDAVPNVDFLRQRDDLERFRGAYRLFQALLKRDHDTLEELHVFPAVPAPVAVSLGHDLLPKVHPALLVYDFDKAKGGFTPRIRINGHEAR